VLTEIINKLPPGALGFLVFVALLLAAIVITSVVKHLAIMIRGYPPVYEDDEEDDAEDTDAYLS